MIIGAISDVIYKPGDASKEYLAVEVTDSETGLNNILDPMELSSLLGDALDAKGLPSDEAYTWSEARRLRFVADYYEGRVVKMTVSKEEVVEIA